MYKILKAEKLADKIYLMNVHAPRVASHCQPGQFVIVKMDEKGERIPLTICDYDREAGTITIVFQEVGASTVKMGELKAGDSFRDFTGPLGCASEFVHEDLESLKNKKMLFHMRETFPGTILVDGDKIEKLNTKTKETISPLVYPSWHPSGKYVAFSVNTTKQAFHLNDRNRVEVYDEASDVVVYDVEKHEIVTASNIFSKDAFETFPTFSPDGKTLYFCTAEARPIPQEYSEVKYNLCSVSFDPVTRAFGAQVDTLYNAKSGGMSASFPRVSPDGRYLLYTLSGYGNFSIWHKDADLYMADLQTGTSRPLVEVNSDDVESYHSWSSNSRWFGSRRIDGLYTRPYIAYVDEDGKVGKPFLLPQKDAGFYQSFMKSFNIPEFITGKVKVRGRVLAIKAKEDKGTDVRLAQQ